MPTIRTFIDGVSVTPGDRGRSFIFVGSTLGQWKLPSLGAVPRGWTVGLRNSGPADVHATPVHGDTIEGLAPSAFYNHVPFSGAVYVADVSVWRQSMLFAPGGVPTGGTANQILRKLSSIDYDDAWQDAPMTVAAFFPGKQSSAEIVRAVMTDGGTFPANFAGSFATARLPSAGTAVFTINVNAAIIGTATFDTSATASMASSGGFAHYFVAGDLVEIIAPAVQDVALADIAISLRAIRT